MLLKVNCFAVDKGKSLICRVLIEHSFLQGWNPPPFLREPHPFWVTPLSKANLKSYPPLSESHPN